MLQTAVFVDAGYLYAQGSALLVGEKQARNLVRLDVPQALKQFEEAAIAVAPAARLLRIYWYDGILPGGRLTTEQSEIAHSPNVKLRLGTVNSRGEQKGVDSLIVTDLIDLSRNQAISDALILSGDEDIRVGVQVAQTYGVRVHLLGIKPARGSQSPDLVQEVDSHHEWTQDVIGAWMKIEATSAANEARTPSPRAAERRPAGPAGFDASAVTEARTTIRSLDETGIRRAVAHLDETEDQIPPEIDRPTLARLRNRLDRTLTDDERRRYRKLFASELRSAAAASIS